MRVQIEHPTTGERYEIELADHRRTKLYRDPKSGELVTYAAAGFQIAANADGSPYEEPKPAEKGKEG